MKLSRSMITSKKLILSIEIIGFLFVSLLNSAQAQVSESLDCGFPADVHPGRNTAPMCIVPKRTGRPFSSQTFGLPTQKGVNEALAKVVEDAKGREAVLREELGGAKSELSQTSAREHEKIYAEITAIRDSIGETSARLPELIINDPRFRALIEEAVRKAFNNQK